MMVFYFASWVTVKIAHSRMRPAAKTRKRCSPRCEEGFSISLAQFSLIREPPHPPPPPPHTHTFHDTVHRVKNCAYHTLGANHTPHIHTCRLFDRVSPLMSINCSISIYNLICLIDDYRFEHRTRNASYGRRVVVIWIIPLMLRCWFALDVESLTETTFHYIYIYILATTWAPLKDIITCVW